MQKKNHRVLVCVTGMSPQIVTETLFALACGANQPVWMPDEIHLLTTQRGSENARLTLLSNDPGWFHQLRKDYSLPSIAFNEQHIHVISDAKGKPLSDIRDDADNQCAADGIAEFVRQLSQRDDSEIHASIAGGRKTMGFFLGYAMSLWGRPQDRLSHVLVSSAFESRSEFFYPTPQSRVIPATDKGQDTLDAANAKVWLGDIPFVRLRSLLPASMHQQSTSFTQAVAAANRTLNQVEIVIDWGNKAVVVNEHTVKLSPWSLSLLTLLAWRKINAKPPLRPPLKSVDGYDHQPDMDWKDEVRSQLNFAIGEMNIPESVYKCLTDPDESASSFFEQNLARLEKKIKSSGAWPLAQCVERVSLGKGRLRGYQLPLASTHIRIISPQACKASASNKHLAK